MRNTFKKTLAGASVAALLLGPMAVFAAPDGPTVTLSSSASFTAAAPTNVTWVTPIPVSVTISSSTTEFDASDVSVTGAMTVDNWSGSGTSYSFTVTPGDGDPLHANQPRYVRIEVHGDKFSGNQASNAIEFWFDPAAAPVDATAPAITFTDPSPADNSTITTSSDTATTTNFTFAWTVDDASSTIKCSIVGSGSADSFYDCGSPQSFTSFPLGTYRFTVQATDQANNMASSSRTFTIATGTAPAPAPTPAPSGGSSTSSGGGGGGGIPVGLSPIGPQAAGGMNWGVINPNPVVVQVPSASSPSPDVYVAPATPEPAPTVSTAAPTTPVRTVSGTAPRSTTVAAVTPAQSTAETPAPAPAASVTPVPAAQDNLQGAAAVTAPDVPVAVWVWSLIGIAAIALLGWLFYRPA